MTTLDLLALILAALLLQLAAGIGIAMRRRHAAAAMPAATTEPAAAPASPGAWAGWREFRVAQRVFEDPTQSQCSFHLQPADGQALPEFKPGQYLTFMLQVKSPAAGPTRTVTRCYSLSDRPDPAHYRVTIKRVPAPADHPEWPPGVSSTHFHDHVQVGDLLRVKAPAGQFTLDPDPNLPVVLIGGGIGITPMMSMLRWCAEHQPQRAVHLYYGLRSRDEHAFGPALKAMAAAHPALRLNIVYSRPGEEDVQGRDFHHLGHVDIALLQRTLPHGRHGFYVCGPPAMMQALMPALAAWGVAPPDLHHEAFGPASLTPPGSLHGRVPVGSRLEVRFQRSGRTLAWDGRDASLLDFAERHGIEVDSGCRSGSCGTCETRLLAGTVRYGHAPDHPVAAGHCLPCVGRPSTAVVLQA